MEWLSRRIYVMMIDLMTQNLQKENIVEYKV